MPNTVIMVIARLNPSQFREQFLNHIGDKEIERLTEQRKKNDLMDMEKEFFRLMEIVNPKERNFLWSRYQDIPKADRMSFFDRIINDDKCIYFHEPPFWGNTGNDQFRQIFREMPWLCERDRFVGIEKPMIMGELYFMRLKHESSNKFSARSTGLANPRYLPAKSSLKKEKRILFSNTPIRLGRRFQTCRV
jgi:hypothetical protein